MRSVRGINCPVDETKPTRGEELRDGGIALVVDTADGWHGRALDTLHQLAIYREHVHANDLRGNIAEPDNPHAWGALWMAAVRRGWVVEDRTQERVAVRHVAGHAHRTPVYRSLLWCGF